MVKRAALLVALATVLGACRDGATEPDPVGPVSVSLQPVAQGLSSPVFLTAPAGDLDRLFVVERGGTIRIIRNGSVLPTPFLTVRPADGTVTPDWSHFSHP